MQGNSGSGAAEVRVGISQYFSFSTVTIIWGHADDYAHWYVQKSRGILMISYMYMLPLCVSTILSENANKTQYTVSTRVKSIIKTQKMPLPVIVGRKSECLAPWLSHVHKTRSHANHQ